MTRTLEKLNLWKIFNLINLDVFQPSVGQSRTNPELQSPLFYHPFLLVHEYIYIIYISSCRNNINKQKIINDFLCTGRMLVYGLCKERENKQIIHSWWRHGWILSLFCETLRFIIITSIKQNEFGLTHDETKNSTKMLICFCSMLMRV